MRSLVTGDLHLSHNPRDAYRFEFMKWFASLARDRKPDQIIIAGDLTEEKDRHPAKLVNQVVECVHALAKIAPVVVVEGNHDYKDEGHAFFRFLSRVPNTRWVWKPSVVGDILCLPHTNDYQRDWASLDLAAYANIVCHQTFNGADVGFGRSLEGIPPDVLPRKSTVLCGDIHVPSDVGRPIYIGAPYHVDFGDDFKARIIEHTGSTWRSIDTSTLPQKRALNVSADDAKLGKANKGDLVSITVEVDTMEGWAATRERIEAEAERRKLQVWTIKPKVMKHAVRRQHKVADAKSDLDILGAFGKRHGLSTGIMRRGEKLL
jgi:predicted phosphodiesterase